MKRILIHLLLLALLFGVGALLWSGKAEAALRTILPHRVVQVIKPEPSLRQLVSTVPPKYGLPPILVAAIIERESGSRRDAIRYEPSQLTRARKLASNPDDQRMYASSIGYMQIMAWHAPKYQMTWADLLDAETNIELGCTILKDCWDRSKEKDKFRRYHAALACYNGSTAYADAVMGRLGRLMINEVL